MPPSPFTIAATEALRAIASQEPDIAHLSVALRHLAKWRAELVTNTIVSWAGTLVECHDVMQPGLTDLLAQRFAATHSVTQIDASALPAWMEGWTDLDRLIALWEWRGGPTPWLWMQVK